MRVLFLTHSYPRAPGDAAGSFLLNLAIALRDEDVAVWVLAPAGDRLPADDVLSGIPVHRFRYAPRRFQRLAYTGQMAEEVRRSVTARLALAGLLGAELASGARLRRLVRPDVVHAHWWFPGGLVGSALAGLTGLPLITTMHGSDVRLAQGSAAGRWLLRHVVRRSRAVTTVSRWLADQVRELAPGSDPIVAPMPVAVSLFSPGGRRHERRFLFVGRLNEQKGIALLLEALALVPGQPELDVVGDGVALQALRQRAATLGLSERVYWHGALPQPRLVSFYQQATALVVPSQEEGFGLVAVEAQLCETPVVAFASGGLPDIIEPDVTGYLVSPGDVRALAECLACLLADPDARARVGRAGRQSALARFAPSSVARRYADIYREAAAFRRSRA